MGGTQPMFNVYHPHGFKQRRLHTSGRLQWPSKWKPGKHILVILPWFKPWIHGFLWEITMANLSGDPTKNHRDK